MRNDFYVYSHNRISDGKTFYIGKGRGARVKNGENRRNDKWQEITTEEGGFTWSFLHSDLNEKEAFKLEAYEIRKIGIHNLCNIPNNRGNVKFYRVFDLLGKETVHRGWRSVVRETALNRDRVLQDVDKGVISRGSRCNCNGWKIESISSDQYYRLIKS